MYEVAVHTHTRYPKLSLAPMHLHGLRTSSIQPQSEECWEMIDFEELTVMPATVTLTGT